MTLEVTRRNPGRLYDPRQYVSMGVPGRGKVSTNLNCPHEAACTRFRVLLDSCRITRYHNIDIGAVLLAISCISDISAILLGYKLY
jgi:hypothetical protein